MGRGAFNPDYAVSPGMTIRDILDEREMSQSEFATRMGMSQKTISQMINGVAPITYETASRLELVLGAPSNFWNSRESHYRSALLRKVEDERLAQETAWLKSFPLNEMASRKCISLGEDKGGVARQVLAFFGVSDIPSWKEVWINPQVKFRGKQAHEKHPEYVAVWIRLGEIVSSGIECQEYDAVKFRESLIEIRGLTTKPASEWQKRLRDICASCGVAFVLIKEIPGAGVSGITKWTSKTKATIQLSLKYKTDDQFWFSFFHEACHVLKHGKTSVFYENGKRSDDPAEIEADEFARDILISREHAKKLPFLKRSSDIRDFATSIGISPGIVVGRLQHDGLIQHTWCNDLKRRYEWK